MFIRIKKGFELYKIGDETVALYTGGDTVDLRQGIMLNPVAEMLFSELLVGCDRDTLVEKMVSQYDISRQKAETDLALFVKNLSVKGLLEE